GAEVTDERLDDVALLEIERVRGGDRLAFLAEGTIETADDFRLAEERDEALLERARESKVVIDFQKLIAAEAFRHGRRTLSSNGVMLNVVDLLGDLLDRAWSFTIDHWIFLLVVVCAIVFRKSVALTVRSVRLPSTWMQISLIVATSLAMSIAYAAWHGMPIPQYHDDFAYLLDADTFEHGRMSNPTHPLWPHFETMHVLQMPRYISKYPVGQGLIFAAGSALLGHPLRAVWLLGAATCVAV